MTWRNAPKMAMTISKNDLKEKARATLFSSFFDYQGIRKNICAKFCKEQFPRNRNIYPKLLPDILKMTCSKYQHSIFLSSLVIVRVLSRINICAKSHEKVLNSSQEIKKHTQNGLGNSQNGLHQTLPKMFFYFNDS